MHKSFLTLKLKYQMKNLSKYIYGALLFLLCIFLNKNIAAQNWPADTINTGMNTGNPSFPFPQFNEYANGKTLAKYNGEGVTHADMEKSMKEGYKIMMHRALYTGQTYGGKKYIVYNYSTVPSNYGTFVSEGDGYALIAAAYFGDKETFDGLWMWVHDNRLSKVKQYFNCTDLRPTYPHGAGIPGWQDTQTDNAGATTINSATDGDVDIAMGLLLAYKQWGDNMGISDACGNPISYKNEALKMIKVLVDTLYYTKASSGAGAGVKGYLSGDVGIDGYIKSGNTWDELTNWRYSAANTAYPWAIPKPDPLGPTSVYPDYMSPGYFNEFSKFLIANGGTSWQINQYRRAEASSDWTIGQMYSKGYIASTGNYQVNANGSTTTFGQFAGGEDFRAAWRTILNYVWHGNPDSTWNPVTHQKIAGGNTYEYDMAVRHASFLKFPRTNPTPANTNAALCTTLGASPDLSCPNWKGVVQIRQQETVTGAVGGDFYRTNYTVGTGAPAAVASGDVDLTAEIYRQNEILWDDVNTALTKEDTLGRYQKGTPKYFHDWFRLLGMLTTSGNLHPPANVTAGANMKVYMSVDKTYAYAADLLTYTVSYRNYGSVTATGVSISTLLDSDYQFVSASNGGALSGSTITWSIGAVPGFQSATGINPTTGKLTFVVRVKTPPVHSRVCLTSTLTATNSLSWTSNEFPNNASYTMQRNCVDLLQDRSLFIDKTTDRALMNPGDIANFKLSFGNKSAANLWLNGGRDRVTMSYGNYLLPSNTFYHFYRIWHSANEAYINLNNYRVSYFLNDAAAIGIYDATTNPTGWFFAVDNQSDLDKYLYNPSTGPITFSYQAIPWGSDANGSWNQRIITRFASVITAPTTHIYDKLDSPYLIHKGVVGPGFLRTRMESTPPSPLAPRLLDDWSYSTSVNTNNINGQALRFTPITNSWANPANLNVPITNYSKDVCDADVPNYDRLLVEEFDGYTWRRIAGRGPLPGRETYNVTVFDTIPKNLTWNGFTDAVAIGVTATYTAAAPTATYSGIVKWTIPVMLVGDTGSLAYQAIATGTCPGVDVSFMNVGWIQSQTDSPDSSRVNLKVTCNPVPPTAPAETSLDKTANKTTVSIGDVITYTLTFTNSSGSTATWAGTGTQAADWQALGTGVIPKLNGSVISLDQNGTGNPSPGGTGYAFGPKKVHGKNGWIEATLNPTNSSMLSFIYRYIAGTPGQTGFQGVRLDIFPNPVGNNTINFTLYNNTTALATLTNISYGGSANPINIRTQLVDDKLYIWINNYAGAPLQVITGITQLSPGYTGIYGNSSQQSISAWKAHFDSSFDLAITDPLPAQLSNPTAISNSGTFAAGTITWPTVPGPILAGVSTVRTFQATVGSCSSFITNIGYASVYGVGNISSQNVVNCLTTVPVELINFSAEKKGEQVNLSWLTVSEKDNDHFGIEKSADGKKFEQIGTIKGNGNSTKIITYQFIDKQPFEGLNYYRLAQYDYDGTIKYSEIKEVDMNAQFSVILYPSPFTQETNILVKGSKNKFGVKIFSVLGEELYSNTECNTNEAITFGRPYSSGVYIIKVMMDENIQTLRVLKE